MASSIGRPGARPAIVALAGAIALATLAACGGGPAGGGGSTGANPRGGGYGLTAAADQVCADRGLAVASYLDTGQPSDDDPAYGVQRNQVLQFRGVGQTEQASILIKQTGDSVISDCEQAERNARTDPPVQAFRIACARLGGAVESLNGGRGCFITYGTAYAGYGAATGAGAGSVTGAGTGGPGAPGGWAALNQDGTFSDQQAAVNERECASFPPTSSGQRYEYYADSGACADQ